MELTPFSPQIIETLRVLIAPGGRMRLSPFVDEAQIRVLFGEQVDPRNRFESTRRILANHRKEIAQIAQEFIRFLDYRRGCDWTQYYRNELVRKSWLINNFPVNVCKVQMALIELVSQGSLHGEISLVDIGIGAGNVPVAVIDFLVAWATVCQLYGLEQPVTKLSYYGYDVVDEWLRLTQEVVSAYLEVLNGRITQVRGEAQAVYEFLSGFKDRFILEALDLNTQLPKVQGNEKVIVFLCNVLSELNDNGKTNLMHLLGALSQDSAAVIIEPGDQRRTQQLNDWRRRFFASIHGGEWSIVAPCGSEFGRELPETCSKCWNLRRDSFHETQLYRAFREEVNKIKPDKRSWDEYENNLLSQSYTVLHKSISTPAERSALRREQGYICGTTRYIGLLGGDTLKLCPAAIPNSGYTSLTLTPSPAYAVPNLRFGNRIRIHRCNYSYSIKENTVRLELPESSHSYIENLDIACVSRPPEGFLPAYTLRTQLAVDELAFRFFGFERMRDFQHDVLRHVLCGKSIFAIAATGGGKSECYILPALLLPGLTIVIAPLKSLMQDQYEQRLRNRYGFGDISTFINGDVPFEERQKRLRRMEQGYYKIVYFTPEQLERDYVLSSLRRAHEKVGLRYIALDEAHCISQWGHDFRPSYLNIVKRLKSAGIDPLPIRIALTATASPKVREDVCRELLLDPRSVDSGGDLYVHSSNRPELNFVVRKCNSTSEKVDDMIRRLDNLKRDYPNDAAIIFMPHTGGDPDSVDWSEFEASRGKESSGVTEFASYLERELKERVCIYHSKMEDEVENVENDTELDNTPYGDLRRRRRRREQEKFIHGDCRVMVATKGFGMGIDKPNVRLVLHRTPPANLEAYIQEAGRAGRDGRFATAVLYFSPGSSTNLQSANSQEEDKSDISIQNYFISSKYVRKTDIEAMIRFMKNCDRRIVDTIYFTNDEVIEFFDSIGQFEQLQFPAQQRTYCPLHLRGVIERGNSYKYKTDYIGKILSAMYSFRPGGTGLLDYVQSVGIQIRNPKIIDAEAIVRSNYYFGELLRQSGVTANEFIRLVNAAQYEEGIIPLARRLRMTLYEVHAMLQDIRTVGRSRGGNKLLDFSGIFVPKYGAAKGKYTIREWLEYAGAVRWNERRAHGKAQQRSPELIQKLCQMCRAPKSSVAQSWIQAIDEQLMRRVGWNIRDMCDNTETARTISLNNRNIRIVSEFHVSNEELIYYRTETEQKIGDRIEEFRRLQRAGAYDAARDFLISKCHIQAYEAAFFSNSNIKCVCISKDDDSLIISLQDPSTTLEDWFEWRDCPDPVGWEVRLSEVFQSEERLNELIDAFMQEHDQRKQDDEKSFEYLLNDYIGVNRENDQHSGACLRAVMLGYLKTNEIVVGDNCYSCSRCVPDEKFSTDIELRKSVVQPLLQEIIDLLQSVEQDYQDALLPEEKLENLWTLCQQELQKGRSVIAYIQGWSGRVLTDTPEHKSVHLLRAEAMYRGVWQLILDEYRYHLQRLCNLCDRSELARIKHLYEYIENMDIDSQESLSLLALYYREIEEVYREYQFLVRLCNRYPSYGRLQRLITISEQHQFVDNLQLDKWRISAARIASDVESALSMYWQVSSFSTLEDIIGESVQLLDDRSTPSELRQQKVLALIQWYLDENASDLSASHLLEFGNQWKRITANYRLGELSSPVTERIVRYLKSSISQLDDSLQKASLQFIEESGSADDLLEAIERVAEELKPETAKYVCRIASTLGNDGVKIISTLLEKLGDVVREDAHSALAEIRTDSAAEVLGRALSHNSVEWRLDTCRRLDGFRSATAYKLISQALDDIDLQVRRTAFDSLCQSDYEGKFECIARALIAPDPNLQQDAAIYLLSHGKDSLFREAIQNPSFEFAREVLGFFKAKGYLEGIEYAFAHPSTRIRRAALIAAVSLSPKDSERYVYQFSRDTDVVVRRLACRLAVKMKLLKMLREVFVNDSERSIARIAAIGIIANGAKEDRSIFARYLNDEDQQLAKRAYEALYPISIKEVYDLICPKLPADSHGYLYRLIREVSAQSDEERVLYFAKLFLADDEHARAVGAQLLKDAKPEIYHVIEHNRERASLFIAVVVDYDSKRDRVRFALYDPDSWKQGYIAQVALPLRVFAQVWQRGTVGQAIVVECESGIVERLKLVGFKILALFNKSYEHATKQLKYWLIHFAPVANGAPVVKQFEGRLRKPVSGSFGFVNDVFVAPRLGGHLVDGTQVQGVAILGFDRKKRAPAWEAVSIMSVDKP